MKKLYTFLVLLLSLATFAQAPEGFNYQATVRNSSGTLMTNKSVTFSFSIIKDSSTGTAVYTETRTVTTDDLGAVNLIVGQGTATTGTFDAIDWSTGTYFLSIGLNTGSGNVTMGTTQLLSVPFAMYAKTAGKTKSQGKISVTITGDITDAQAAAQIAAEVGPDTENVYIYNTTQLTTVDLSKITTLSSLNVSQNQKLVNINLDAVTTLMSSLYVSQNPALIAISMPALKNTSGGDGEDGGLSIYNNTALTSISFPLLTTGSLNISNNAALISITLTALKSSNGGISIGGNDALTSVSLASLTTANLNIGSNKALASVSAPSLTTATDIYLQSNDALASASFPLLATCTGTVYFTNNAALATVSLPALTSARDITISSNQVLKAISIPSFVTATNASISFNDNALPTSLINTLLHQFLGLTASSNWYINLNNQYPPAPATGQGISDKDLLTQVGYTVYTDDAATRNIEITIKDGSTGLIIPNIAVNMRKNGNIMQTSTTDVNGKATFTGISNQGASYNFDAATTDCKAGSNGIYTGWYSPDQPILIDLNLYANNSGSVKIVNNTTNAYYITIAPTSDLTETSNIGISTPTTTNNDPLEYQPSYGDYTLTATKMIGSVKSTLPADIITKTVSLSCANSNITITLP